MPLPVVVVVVAMTAGATALQCGGSKPDDVISAAPGDGGPSGGGSAVGSTQGETDRDAAADADASADAGPTGDAGEGCVPGGDTCGNGRTCLCCGSVGPRSICLCTTACKNDVECPYSTQSLCNHEKSQPGICTPRDFRCCWSCQ